MTPDHIAPLAFGALIGVWGALALTQWALKRQLKAQQAELAELERKKAKLDELERQAATLTPPAPAPLPSSPASRWWSDPSGQRIELADTGFYITFNPSEPRSVYQGHTPEHLRIASGPYLGDMKTYMEARAAERAEFTPREGSWKP